MVRARFLKGVVEEHLRCLVHQLYHYDEERELYIAYGEGEVSKEMMNVIIQEALGE